MVDEHDRRVIHKKAKLHEARDLQGLFVRGTGMGSLLEILSKRMEPLPGHTHNL